MLLPATAPVEPSVPSSVQIETVWDFVVKGGWMMIPIGLCSLITMTVVAERLVSLRRKRIIPPTFLSGLRGKLTDDPNDVAGALEYCRSNGSPVANVFAAGIRGLLGTIFGMITAFQTVATSGEALGKTELLAGGIYEAMITTAAGLIVAIPSLVCYHWLSSVVQRIVMDIDEMSVDFVEDFATSHADGQHPDAAAKRDASGMRIAT
jgi:biopolymer transport protein ExbB